MLTYHGVPAAIWNAHAGAVAYRPEGFEQEGFIHTSPDPRSLADALNRHYAADPRAYLALVIDLEQVASPWRPSRQPELDVEFPHILGPLNRDAVVAVVSVPRTESGRFLPPEPSGRA
ncbi:MAG TPA: DUF952 domain-containing protein [Dehalococcoidia bacterium]|nr:DUF952 domain-containing protein [Dehalococcoidia bacterium]